MLGEFHVLRSIIEYSIPRLIGWSTMMDHSMEQALFRASSTSGGGARGGFSVTSRNENDMVPF
jgi:hypothetical protein